MLGSRVRSHQDLEAEVAGRSLGACGLFLGDRAKSHAAEDLAPFITSALLSLWLHCIWHVVAGGMA